MFLKPLQRYQHLQELPKIPKCNTHTGVKVCVGEEAKGGERTPKEMWRCKV